MGSACGFLTSLSSLESRLAPRAVRRVSTELSATHNLWDSRFPSDTVPSLGPPQPNPRDAVKHHRHYQQRPQSEEQRKILEQSAGNSAKHVRIKRAAGRRSLSELCREENSGK